MRSQAEQLLLKVRISNLRILAKEHNLLARGTKEQLVTRLLDHRPQASQLAGAGNEVGESNDDVLQEVPIRSPNIDELTDQGLRQFLLTVPDKKTLAGWCGVNKRTSIICRRPDFRRDWQMLHTGFPLRGHTDPVNSVAWSPDGTKLASGSSDRSIRIWNVKTAESITILRGHTNSVLSVAWRSPDGTKLTSGSTDKSIRIWDVKRFYSQ